VWKSALTVLSVDVASCASSSVENGTCSSSTARVEVERFVISAYEAAPRDAHSQTCRVR